MTKLDSRIARALATGIVIPAHPLALTSERRLDEKRQRALSRYYIAAGAGGLAVGVHTTQFAIRNPRIGLFSPVLKIAAEEMDRADRTRPEPMVRIGGICGETAPALDEAELLAGLGYHAGLLSLGALQNASDQDLLRHCRTVAETLPIVGFYLQPAAGGRLLSYRFWREFAEIENLAAIKIAPFNRYHTLDVVRAVAESGRPIPLYTGNDDNIVLDLLTPYSFSVSGETRNLRMVGGLLGHWAVGTRRATEMLRDCHHAAETGAEIPIELLQRNIAVTDANAAFFDAAHQFHGCIPGIHEVLRRQGLLAGLWCLDPNETLSPGQKEEIERVHAAYPHLNDDDFISRHLDQWLRP